MSIAFLDDIQFEIEDPASSDLVIVLLAELRFHDGLRTYTIPKGFRCDLSSVPLLFRSIAAEWWRSARAGTLHDGLYRFFEIWLVPRAEADTIYRRALILDDVHWFVARSMWFAVRAGGWFAWRRHRKTPMDEKGVQPPPIELDE